MTQVIRYNQVNANVVNAAVKQYAKADGDFFAKVADMARVAGATGEQRWNKEYAPLFKAALDKFMPSSAAVILSRVKVAFIGKSNGIEGPDALRPYYEETKAKLQAKGLVKSTGAGKKKGANANKGAARGKGASATQAKVATPTSLQHAAFMICAGNQEMADLLMIASSVAHKDQLAKYLRNQFGRELRAERKASEAAK